jgi:pyruvyltransferase
MNNSVHNIFCLDSINFGDAVNTRFWKEMTEHNIINNTNDVHYFTAGSIMCLVKNNTIILGSGFISENGDIGGGNFMSNNNNKICEPKSVISVRGPLTRDKLIKYGIECPTNYGDPLILMPCIYIKQATVNNNIIGIIPHYIDKKNINVVQLKINLENAGYTVKIIDIDIADNYEELIDNINMCEYIISSSLHGVIMGIVYKKKTCFLEFSNNVIFLNLFILISNITVLIILIYYTIRLM